MNLRVSETSITEELLYKFYEAFWEGTVPIKLFESIDEHKNGSDIEVLVKTDSGYILLTCQAKITYKSGNYKSFYHEVAGKRQIDLLRDYAKRHGGVPQYLLYNFMPLWRMSKEAAKLENYSDHGITYVPADDIYEWMEEMADAGKKPKVPGFNQFHPKIAKPFHELLCAMLRGEKASVSELIKTNTHRLKYYSDKEMSNPDSWRKITKLATIGYVAEVAATFDQNGDIEASYKQKKAPPEFKPKFRIVIGGEVNTGQITSIR